MLLFALLKRLAALTLEQKVQAGLALQVLLQRRQCLALGRQLQLSRIRQRRLGTARKAAQALLQAWV
jgi:hypothetical protein